jgi:hypothetical protein
MIMKSPDIDGMYEFYKGLKFNASVTLSNAYVAGSSMNRAGLALTANDAVGAGLVNGDGERLTTSLITTSWTLSTTRARVPAAVPAIGPSPILKHHWRQLL